MPKTTKASHSAGLIWKLTAAPVILIGLLLLLLIGDRPQALFQDNPRILIISILTTLIAITIVILTKRLATRMKVVAEALPLIGEGLHAEAEQLIKQASGVSVAEIDALERSVLNLSEKMQSQEHTINQSQEELERISLFDNLTGLPNRHLFLYEVQNELEQSRENSDEHLLAVVLMDLDNFKRFNDSLGHQMGDLILQKMGERLQRACGNVGMLGRPGGDEFALLLSNVKRAEQLNKIAAQLLEIICRPLELEISSAVLSSSLGVAVASAEDNASDLLRHAEIAMYRAKHQGGNQHCMFKLEMASAAHEDLLMESEIRRAFNDGEYTLYLQPKVDASRKIRGFEALVRWEHPEKGLIPPGQFIPVMERINFISKMDDWILDTSCRQLKILMNHFPGLSIAVNISSTHFAEESFLTFLQYCIQKHDIDPSHLELEITESMLMENMAAARSILERIRALGVSIAIDDFGTGYSSLSYLKDLPVNTVKIDRAFIKDIPDNVKDMQISSVIIYLARQLDYKVVAEGVETEEQLEFLRQSQCDLMQGFYFSKPIPAHKVMLMLETERLLRIGTEEELPNSDNSVFENSPV